MNIDGTNPLACTKEIADVKGDVKVYPLPHLKVVKALEVQMKESAKHLQFEKAAHFRDEIYALRRLLVLEEKTLSPVGVSAEK